MTTTSFRKAADYNARNLQQNYEFILARINVHASLIDEKTKAPMQFPRSVSYPCIEEVYFEDEKDPSKSRMRVMVLITGEKSLWADEQSWFERQNIKEVSSRIKKVEFKNGILVVNSHEKLLLDFLRRSNANKNTKGRNQESAPLFQELDNDLGLAAVIEDENRESKLRDWCNNGPIEEIYAYAKMFNLPADTMSDISLRFNLKNMVKKNPIEFEKGLNRPLLQAKYVIEVAKDKGLITVDPSMGSVKWTNGGIICYANPGQDPEDKLLDTLLVPGEGEKLLFNIKKHLGILSSPDNQPVQRPSDSEVLAAAVKESGKPTELLTPTKTLEELSTGKKKAEEMSYEEFLLACKAKGLMEQKATWTYLYKEGKEVYKANSKEKIKTYLKGEGKDLQLWYLEQLNNVLVIPDELKSTAVVAE